MANPRDRELKMAVPEKVGNGMTPMRLKGALAGKNLAFGGKGLEGASEGLGEKVERRLAVEQQTALELMILGKSMAETAREAGVSRSTVYQWLRNDPVFQAAYNQWHDQLQESCRSRLLTLTDKATDALEKALEAGDARAALQLLKGMGMIRPKEPGPTDPAELKRKMDMDRTRKSRRMVSEEFDAEFGL